MSWALFLLGAKRVGTAVITWLSHRSFWQLMCIALAIFAVVQTIRVKAEQRHSAKVEAQLSKAVGELQRIDREARKAQSDGQQISKEIRGKTDEENRRIAGDADSVRVRGPGKALCRPATAAAGGHGQSAPVADAPGPSLPPADSAAVPWGWLTDRSEEHDRLLAENKAWREWYQRLVAAWPK